MKAAVVHEFKEPIRIEDVETPRPGSDEVLIRIEACGVCHSDLHLAEGDWPQLKFVKKPLILGHEVVGRVAEKGDGVDHLQIGDRVGVAWTHWTCGECDYCKEGAENLCKKQLITGASVDGGYAELMKAKASHALKVPESLSSDEAAPLFCAGVTVYHAIKKSGVKPEQRIVIFGIGGLGHLAVQVAKTFGPEVIAVDIADDKLELAERLGADRTINAAKEDVVKVMRQMGGAHVAVITSAAKAAFDAAFYSVRSNGKMVVVGMPADILTFPAIQMREVNIVASATGTRQDISEVLELAAAGKIRCLVETEPVEKINEIFDRMKAGQITGRVVLTF